MKPLTLFLLLSWSVGSLAQVAGSTLISNTASQESFFVLLGADCQSIYYAPRSYTIEENKSSAILSTQTSGEPVILVNAYLSPRPAEPSDSEREQMKRWASDFCGPATLQIVKYPSLLQNLRAGDEVQGFNRVETSPRSDGSKLIQFEVLPRDVSLETLLINLKYFRPELEVQILSSKTDASASVEADAGAVSTFVLNRYTEQVCTESRTCIFGICKKKHHCDYVTKIVQELQGLDMRSKIQFAGQLAYGVPFSEYTSLQEELVSRMMMSLFVETSRVELEDVTKVTLGKMNKNYASHYSDAASKIRIGKSAESTSSATPDLAAHFTEILSQIYKSKKLYLTHNVGIQ